MIVVFGSINLDLVARVARLPRAGETLVGRAFAIVPGGKGANQALAARRAGADVALCRRRRPRCVRSAGPRAAGAAGVDLAGVRTLEAPTGLALIHVDADGRNAITVVAGRQRARGPGLRGRRTARRRTTLVLQFEVPLAASRSRSPSAHGAAARGSC